VLGVLLNAFTLGMASAFKKPVTVALINSALGSLKKKAVKRKMKEVQLDVKPCSVVFSFALKASI